MTGAFAGNRHTAGRKEETYAMPEMQGCSPRYPDNSGKARVMPRPHRPNRGVNVRLDTEV
jgi:hypothetical protein